MERIKEYDITQLLGLISYCEEQINKLKTLDQPTDRYYQVLAAALKQLQALEQEQIINQFEDKYIKKREGNSI